uniref:Uncharacterized protein n=1 Tax=Setaria viridis TaxID=4556 RepID=A0A4U6T7N2_SETVI|nr:hypothetical protein SEVIR_9G411150v2 [Setaria viridis]
MIGRVMQLWVYCTHGPKVWMCQVLTHTRLLSMHTC